MSSPLFDAMGAKMSGPMGEMQQMMSAFRQFKQSFRGDPREEVQRMLNSGQITQAQYNTAQQMAGQIARMMGG